jgi:nucleotide-binding universal stress UspA family protein
MIKKILVPVDFSDTAADATRYALALGLALGKAEICIAHVFMPQVDSEYPTFIPPLPEMTNFRQKMLEEFCGGIKELKEHQGIRVEKDVWIGFPADEIVRRSGEYDLIIMGTTGEGGFLDKVFGSVSTAVAQRADCPVILVPSGAAYSRINRVLYAGHYDAADTRMVEQLVAFNELFRACVHFVHVKAAGAQAERFQEEKEQIFSVLFRGGEPAFAFEIAEIEGDSVAEALNTYAEENNMELVVLVTRRRNFWAQLFHKSVTRGLVRIARQPLMVLRLD